MAFPSIQVCRELQAKAVLARRENTQRLKTLAAIACQQPVIVSNGNGNGVPVGEMDDRRKRILQQIDILDNDFESATPDLRVKITASKARLWELLYPKPGSLRPRVERSKRQSESPNPVSDPTPANGETT